MNRVTLVGRITKDPELRNSANGTSFCSFSIAVNRALPNAQGERVADFINCVVFNKQAENLARYIKKGGLLGVDGRLQTRTYQAQDGSNRTAVDVVCDNISFLEPKNPQAQSNQRAYNDYSSYSEDYNQLPQSEMQRSAPRPQNPYNQAPVQSAPVKPSAPEPANDFNDSIGGQFDIPDSDLPF